MHELRAAWFASCSSARMCCAWAADRAFVEGQLEVRGAVRARKGQAIAVNIVAAEDGLVESLVLQQRQWEIVALSYGVSQASWHTMPDPFYLV